MTAATNGPGREPVDDLSRILHEMAGSASMCWNPRPSGEFDSGLACAIVAKAMAEVRAMHDAAIDAAREAGK